MAFMVRGATWLAIAGYQRDTGDTVRRASMPALARKAAGQRLSSSGAALPEIACCRSRDQYVQGENLVRNDQTGRR